MRPGDEGGPPRDRLDTATRDAAAALRRIAATLGVPVATLFTATDLTDASASPEEVDALVQAFTTLKDRRTRQRILAVVQGEAEQARREDGLRG